jgi:type VI secretion system ImpB/VipA family protein
MTQYLEVLGRVYKELYAYVEAGEPPAQIGTIKSAVGEALGQTALLIQNFTPEANALVKPVLEQPIKMALTLTPAEDTSGAASPTLAPLTPPSLSGGGGGSGLVVGGLVTARGESSPIEKAVLYLLKAGSREVTLNNYLTLATTGADGTFKFPKAMPPGKYGLFVKAEDSGTVSPGHRAECGPIPAQHRLAERIDHLGNRASRSAVYPLPWECRSMSERFSFGNLDVHLSAAAGRSGGTPSSEVPFRIAILGDFSGQAGRENPRARQAKLRPILIDRDNFEEVLQKLRVEAHLQLGTSQQRLILRFQSLDDFHPDQILARVPLFAQLYETRKKLSHPSTFAEAAAEVRRWAGEQPATPPKKGEGGQPHTDGEENALSAGFLLEDLKEREIAKPAATSDLSGMLRDLVKPYSLPSEISSEPCRLRRCVGALMKQFPSSRVSGLGGDLERCLFLGRRRDRQRPEVYLLDTKDELRLQSADDLQNGSTGQSSGNRSNAAQIHGGAPRNYVRAGVATSSVLVNAKIASAAGRLRRGCGSSLIGCQSLAATPDPASGPCLGAAVCQWKPFIVARSFSLASLCRAYFSSPMEKVQID